MLASYPMPGTLEALAVFVAERQRCHELDGGVDNGYVWLQCSCGLIVHPASEPPQAVSAATERTFAACLIPPATFGSSPDGSAQSHAAPASHTESVVPRSVAGRPHRA